MFIKKIREKKRDTFKYFILMSIVATPFTIQQAVNKGASLAFVVVSFLLWFIFIICVWMICLQVCMYVCMYATGMFGAPGVIKGQFPST